MRSPIKNTLRVTALFIAWTAATQSCNWPTTTTCADGIGCVSGTGGDAGGGAGGTLSTDDAGAPSGGVPPTGTGGSSSGGSGNGGATVAGAAGAAGEPPCDGACSSNTPVCKLETNTCVQCLTHADCVTQADGGAGGVGGLETNGGATNSAGAAAAAGAADGPESPHLALKCKAQTNTCVECLSNADCHGNTAVCDLTANRCVQCLAQTDCTNPAAAVCDADTHTCGPCKANNQCAHIPGKNLCTFAGECVQCTAQNSQACGSKDGTPLVCNGLTHSCSADVKEHSSGYCDPCIADAQCGSDQLCVLDQFSGSNGTMDVGYFCHQKASAVQNDCSTARPYVKLSQDVTSIDGETTDICVLTTSTCVANAQFRQKECSVNGSPDNTQCGVSPPADATCQQFNGTYRCTMTCLSNDDCRSPSTCNTGTNPAVCRFF